MTTKLMPRENVAEFDLPRNPTCRLLEQVHVISDPNGITEVQIPLPCFWDCVDCFGENRLQATYTFTPPHFIARLSHTPPTRIHQALKNWITRQHQSQQSHAGPIPKWPGTTPQPTVY